MTLAVRWWICSSARKAPIWLHSSCSKRSDIWPQHSDEGEPRRLVGFDHPNRRRVRSIDERYYSGTVAIAAADWVNPTVGRSGGSPERAFGVEKVSTRFRSGRTSPAAWLERPAFTDRRCGTGRHAGRGLRLLARRYPLRSRRPGLLPP